MNISEIAELAGVSKAAVSRYFNQGYISEEKRERIRKVVEETGYQPSAQAQTLRTKKTKTIGVIIPKINSDSVSRVVAGISQVLDQSGYQLLLGNTYNNPEKELEYLKLFSDKRVDGIIFLATILTPLHKKALKSVNVPVVLVGQRLSGYNCVYHDDYHAIKEMTSRLHEMGCKEIGYLGVTQKDEAAGVKRQEGFKAALDLAPGLTGHIVIADFSLEAGYEKIQELLRKLPALDGVVCATDSIAIGAMQYLKEQGKRVPEDIRITGVGDSKMAGVTTPSITTVHYFYKTSGSEAAKILLESIEGKNVVKEICMGYEVKEQQST